MSKRPRDEASIATIKEVLGDIPIETIESLLHRSNNNVDAAVNLYFSGSLPSSTTAVASSPFPRPAPAPSRRSPSCSRPTQSSTQKSKSGSMPSIGVKYYIGDLDITGYSMINGVSGVKEGDPISIMRDKVFNSTNKIVRFAVEGKEIGRLLSEHANYISTLLDHRLCDFEGSMGKCPPILNTGKNLPLTIKCYMLPPAIHTTSFMPSVIPQAKKRSRTKSIQDPVIVRKLALIQLFKNLAMRPVRSSIQNMNVGGKDTWDMILQTAIKKEKDTSNDDTVDPDTEEEKKEVTDGHLDTIYEKAQMFDAQIKPMNQPLTMALELKEYQKRALAWMMSKEAFEQTEEHIDARTIHPLWEEYAFPNECAGEYRYFYFNPYNGQLSLEFPEANSQERGGILADEMGLGKTIEILSLIHTNRFNKDIDMPPNPLTVIGKVGTSHKKTIKKSPTTLIVCPMSLLAQWRDEVIRGSNPGTITVDVFYDDKRNNISTNKLSQWNGTAPDVLITTYSVLMHEWNKFQNQTSHESPLFSIQYWRVVLDEAHHIKNRTAKTSQACQAIHAKRRWAVTGTPIQNKLDDLYSLVRFLRHEPWANHTFWRTFITLPFEKQDPRALAAVQSVLEPIVLRRTKTMRDGSGQPMVPLPPKQINIEYLSFSPEEQDIYDAIYKDSQNKFSYFCDANSLGKNYATIFQLLTRLRQICCHPYLAIQSSTTKDKNMQAKSEGGKGIQLEDLIAKLINSSSQQIQQESKIDDVLSSSSQGGHISYGLSILQNLLALQSGSTPAVSALESDTPSDTFSTFSNECPICFESSDAIIAMPCMHMACRPCIMDYFQKKEDEGVDGECPVCRYGPIQQSDLLEINQRPTNTQQQDKIKFDIRKAVGDFKPSTKMTALIRHLRQNARDGCKTVVFSQFTSFMDLIGEALDYECISFTRLDGTQSQVQREKVLADFSRTDGSGASVLLISLRAGGVGLNLTCANRVVMMDPWWNFAIEAQAIDRVHRLGQLKEVTVTRFVMRESVEERILEIQNRKHVLANELYQSRNDAKHRRFEDLQLLFSKGNNLTTR